MKEKKWYMALGLMMLVLSAAVYFIHYAIFRDVHHIFIYMVGDTAFVFIEVLVVSLIIHAVLEARDRNRALEKMNMVIGAFFSEVGTELLRSFCSFDVSDTDRRRATVISGELKESDFSDMKEELSSMEFRMDSRAGDLERLKELLLGKRDFMVRLLENPILLEHETFTDLLWAVFHLAEELACRDRLTALPEPDYDHLSVDIRRAYESLTSEWIGYMMHLQKNYPYLFSLAVRTNPFDPAACAMVSA